MNLAQFDGMTVRITCADGGVFEGACLYNSAEYGEAELGRDEESLEIDNWVFYARDVRSVEPCAEKETSLWMSRPMHRRTLKANAFRLVEDGEKTVEPCLDDALFRAIQVGDVIRFESAADETDVLYAEVKATETFLSVAQLFASLPYDACGCTSADVSRLLSEEKAASCGAAAILFELL